MQSTPLRGLTATTLIVTGVLMAGLLVGCEGGKTPTQVIGEGLGDVFSPSPSEAARDAFNVYDADKRRRAVVLLSNAEWGGEPPYVRTYRLLVDDPDPTVRAAAVSALGRHGDRTDVAAIVTRLEVDANPSVRWEAAKALQEIHSDQAVEPLIAALQDDHRDVRMAAATALGQYPSRSVFDALVGSLNDEDYGVVKAAEKSLQTLTGQDFGDRGGPWWQWAKDNPSVFADKKTYYVPQYEAPPTLLQSMAFWTDKTPPPPEQPRDVANLAVIEAGSPLETAEPGATEPKITTAPPIVTREPAPEPAEQPLPRPQPQPEPGPSVTVTSAGESEPRPTTQPQPTTVVGPAPGDTQAQAASTTSTTHVAPAPGAADAVAGDGNTTTVTASSDDGNAAEPARSTGDEAGERAVDDQPSTEPQPAAPRRREGAGGHVLGASG